MQTFDTHKFDKEFQKASSKEAQAEVIAQTLAQNRDMDLSRLATKEQFELTKQELKQEMKSMEVFIIKWNVAAIVAIAGIMAAMFKYLAH